MTSIFPQDLPAVSLDCTAQTTLAYAGLTNDFNPLHVDAEFAAGTPFGGPIAHGTMALNLLLAGIERRVGPDLMVADVSVRFVAPTPLPNRLTSSATRRDDGGAYDVAVVREDGTAVMAGSLTLAPRAASEAQS
ncbi:MaoC family dehydratase [Amorphus sp. 3PC139-8]|uniref:MaoC family dehydratase n=1 Tax=Amorphus sp. 3PC139-8 TaxID=2735676 RepID=UPI00345CAA42